MGNKILFPLIVVSLIGTVYNGQKVSQLNANEERNSQCANTKPNSKQDCYDKDIDEDDDICCYFEIENHRKEKEIKCAGLTMFQYNHIKLYVKEKMDELLYRDLNIYCNSSMNKNIFIILILFLSFYF